MILKVNSNPNFNLSLIQHIDYDNEYIEFLVKLNNTKNNKIKMDVFRADEFKKALQRFREYEQFIF